MFFLLMAAAAALAPAMAAPPQPVASMPIINPDSGSALCPETPMSLARKMGERASSATPLTELPPAHLFLAVDRRIDGCAAPIIVTSGIGGR